MRDWFAWLPRPLALAALLLVDAAAAAPVLAAPVSPALKPLIRSFEAYARDLDRLDQIWPDATGPQRSVPLPALPAPAPGALPQQPAQLAIEQRQRIELQ